MNRLTLLLALVPWPGDVAAAPPAAPPLAPWAMPLTVTEMSGLAALAAGLDGADFAKREDAQQLLARLPDRHGPALDGLSKSAGSPEVRVRLRRELTRRVESLGPPPPLRAETPYAWDAHELRDLGLPRPVLVRDLLAHYAFAGELADSPSWLGAFLAGQKLAEDLVRSGADGDKARQFLDEVAVRANWLERARRVVQGLAPAPFRFGVPAGLPPLPGLPGAPWRVGRAGLVGPPAPGPVP
jgi:hypothetical protein